MQSASKGGPIGCLLLGPDMLFKSSLASTKELKHSLLAAMPDVKPN